MKKNKIIGLPTEIDATNTSDNPSGIKDGYDGNLDDKIIAVGGADYDSYSAGLWFSRADIWSGNAYGVTGSRLIRHQTSGGREVTAPQQGKQKIIE